MTTEVSTLPPLPGGVAAGDGILTVRPGSPAAVYTLSPSSLALNVAAFEAVLALLPTTAPAGYGKAWLNGGVLNLTGQAPPPSPGGGPPPVTNHVINNDGSVVRNIDGSYLTFA